MDVKKDAWFVRWFHYSLLVCDEFFREGYGSRFQIKDGISLCVFVRTIFLGTTIALLHVTSYLSLAVALTILPIYLFGITHYLIAVAVLANAFLVIGKSVQYFERKKKSAPVKEKAATTKRETGFMGILWQYAKATKEKVCPIIHLN